MSQENQCVISRRANSQVIASKHVKGLLSRLATGLDRISVGWAAETLSSVYSAQAQTRLFGKKMNRRLVRSGVGVIGLSLLSGCSVDMSRFAGAVGGATAEFTCAIVQLLFACEL